jgi:hypothetical protein
LTRYKRLFISCAAVFGGYVSAQGSPILLGSYGTASANPGVANTAVTYDPLNSTVNSGSTSTFDISPGTVWHAALPNSSYVSFNASTGPTSTLVAPNGDYIYNTTFTLAAADAADVATLSLLADDTVSVYLNNLLIQQSGGPMGPGNTYTKCSDTGPNCTRRTCRCSRAVLPGSLRHRYVRPRRSLSPLSRRQINLPLNLHPLWTGGLRGPPVFFVSPRARLLWPHLT